jgi:hypothetical protein
MPPWPVDQGESVSRTAAARVIPFLRERGAREIRHPGGDLLSHLLRTLRLLREWGAPEFTALTDSRCRCSISPPP